MKYSYFKTINVISSGSATRIRTFTNKYLATSVFYVYIFFFLLWYKNGLNASMELYMIKKSLQIFLHFLPLLPFGAIYKKPLAASVHPQNSSAKISPTRDSNVVKPPREGGTSALPAGELTSVQINARTIAKVPSSVGAAGNRHKNIRNPLQSIDTTLKATRKGRCHCSEKKKPTKIKSPPPLQFESVCFSSGTKVS